jgi:serine/threonine protein kinase
MVDKNDRKYAAKIAIDHAKKEGNNCFSMAKGEINSLSIGEHPNIIQTHALLLQHSETKAYCLINDPSQIPAKDHGLYKVTAIITDQGKGTDLFNAIHGDSESGILAIPEAQPNAGFAVEVAKQVCDAFCHLHERGYLYRDLKPENIMYDPATHQIKLIDFGYSKPLKNSERTYSYCGTTEYNAPELFSSSRAHGHQLDAWTLGVLLSELTCNHSPAHFSPGGPHITEHAYTLYSNIMSFSAMSSSNKKTYLQRHFRSIFKKNEPLMNLIVSLTEATPETRMTVKDASEILKTIQTFPEAVRR